MNTEFEEAYYYGLRTIARKVALDEINERVKTEGGATIWNGTLLASVDAEAIAYAEDIWPKYYDNDTNPGFEKPWSSIWYHAQI
jgi:hypothetical protein